MNDMINTIIHGDCLDVMQQIENESIDMILCDLPYGITQCEWDSVIDLQSLWSEYKRITKPNAAIVLTCNQPFTSALIMSNLSMFRYCLEWIKNKGVDIFAANRKPLNAHEDIAVFYRHLPAYNKQMREGDPYTRKQGKRSNIKNIDLKGVTTVNNGGRYPLSWILIPNITGKKRHPTEKPVTLMEYLIKTYTNENDLVLDNCIGSGTTAIAALNTNRRFIGIELDANYHQIAVNRVNEWHRERELQTT